MYVCDRCVRGGPLNGAYAVTDNAGNHKSRSTHHILMQSWPIGYLIDTQLK